MTSRLERLFLLLETGQSAFLRRTAAFQIGEIVKTHPNELGQLLDKLKPLVTNSSWETRIAASQTIESIMKYLNENELISNFFQLNSIDPELKLEKFNLNILLESGASLLSSDTQKYDLKSVESVQVQVQEKVQITEKIRQQRNLLNMKLGIDVAGAAKLDTSHIFSDYDILASEAELAQTNEAEMSLKRKGSELKLEADATFSSPNSSNGQMKKLKLEEENEEAKLEEAENHVKSLVLFTKWLFSKLFNSEWEIRHGSATCIREIIKKLVNSLLTNSNINLIPNFDWFEVCLNKLFSVIALDRFADYIGDEVVAPVRETCTQTIGILSKLFTISSQDTLRLCSIVNMFLAMKKNNWETRHSGIMILKYTIAAASASNDLTNLKQIFSLTFENIINCIKDNDDDVRQVASSSLEPVSKQLNTLLSPDQVECLIKILIDVLSDLDDLGTSCSNIMSLLSDLLSLHHNQTTFIRLLNGQSILPRLLPFLNHSSYSVKQTTLNTINKIIVAINSNGSFGYKFEQIEDSQNLGLLFRLLYQQAILMGSENGFKMLQILIVELWETLNYNISPKLLVSICFPFITTWLILLMYPCNQQIDPAYLVSQNSDTMKEYLGSSQVRFEDKVVRDCIQIKCRLLCSKLLSILFQRVSFIEEKDASGSSSRPFDSIVQFLSTQINFKSGLQRFCFSLLIIDLAKQFKLRDNTTTLELIQKNLSLKITNCLDNENTIYFDEIAILFTRLQKEIRFLLTNFHRYLSDNLGLAIQDYMSKNVFTFDDITSLTNLIQERLNSASCPAQKQDLKLIAEIKLLVSNLVELNKQAYQEQEQLQIRSLSALASACIQLNTLCEKMNPMIRPLIECIRFETNSDLQTISSQHLASLLDTCSKRQPNPVPKIFKNLLNYLCNDHLKTPLILSQNNIRSLPDKDFYEINRYYGIISDNSYGGAHGSDLSNGESSMPPTPSTPNTPNKVKKRANSVNNGALSTEMSAPVSNSTAETPAKNLVEKRGAELAFKAIVEKYGNFEQLDLVVPDVVQQPVNQINFVVKNFFQNSNTDELSQIDELNIDANLSKYQELVNYLSLMTYVSSLACLHMDILDKYMEQIPELMKLIKVPLSSVRHLASKCLSTLCKKQLVRTMQILLEYTLDCLDNNEFNLFARQGAIELIFNLFEQLNTDIIPFIVIFIVPILKRMCDLDWYVRSVASQCFGTLVKLYPLSTSSGTDFNSLEQITSTNANILKMKCEQQDFLDQLMDNRKLKAYKLPVEVLIGVKLRPYQQMGVNWLAFLKKFNLHGILCDDMGLGKTLQSICILSGDHHERQNHSLDHPQFEDDDQKFAQSIIICPTTLTNHWHHEIERFVDKKCLRPFIYCGSVAERENLRRLFFNKNKEPSARFNVFIVSYDIIRHDIQYLYTQKWNYCILDEGHLIKSSKTKLSKAIKQIRASHRLILTGTPIQNNVTELWCLFDFLLPGYLGTEKQFHLKYARYIAPQSASFQSKLEKSMSNQEKNGENAKSKSDNGFHQLSVIALESLHKQVLPFLLRRTKEEVLKDLPPKIIQDYYCEMSPLQIELYQDFAKSNVSDNIKKSLGLVDTEEEPEAEEIKKGNGEHVFQALQYLRKVVNHPSLVLNQDHPKWHKIRSEFGSNSLNEAKHSGKLMALKDLLNECGIGNNEENSGNELDQSSVLNQHRVLVFCQLKSMIDIIESELLKKMQNVSFLRLDGTVPAGERFGIVKKFNSDPSIDILLLTTQIGGLGLNLTGADTVIFVEHDWNPQKDLQAMDRAHRIGQTKVVNVYRLITKRTIEEKIMSLQRFKLGIANSVVNIENSNLSSMGTEQLMNMFNRDAPATSEQKSKENSAGVPSGYAKLLENITEVWDETQYENEYNLNNFIKSLN
ncbi:TATA-binding -associated factor 172-like protein [Brachionus plicatilis]|uniref:TATA-binding-associated factor 172-like protein n=1 Tax=Brachionus plicatilis TaxID=10195 RepID=A0A3M7QKX5_BRAPC|nr:TATA-binding -associated factor 172-like protein [Brachionus plicatilis]